MRFNIHGAMLGSVPAFLVSTKGLDFLWPPSSWIYRAIVRDAEILEREIEFAPGVGKVKSGLNKSVSWRTISSLFSMERIEGKFLPYDILRKNANEDSRFDEKGKIKGRKKIPRENYPWSGDQAEGAISKEYCYRSVTDLYNARHRLYQL